MHETTQTLNLIEQSLHDVKMTREDARYLLALELHSDACYLLMAAANRLSHQRSGSQGTIYSQVGLNIWPCPENCSFCYLG